MWAPQQGGFSWLLFHELQLVRDRRQKWNETKKRYLNYDGIDISLYIIRYCQETFERRYPNFHFPHADIFNEFYNPEDER